MNQALANRYSESIQRLFEWAEQGKLHALIDPFFEFPMPLETAKLEIRDTDPLFYEVIAWDQVTYEPPRLSSLTPESLEWILTSLSTERWGIFVASGESASELARHFQKFVIARGPDGNPYFLRFHDASVLDVLLKTWEAKEKNIFFGSTFTFGLPDLDTMDVHLVAHPFGTKGQPIPEDCLIQLRESQLRLCGEAIDRDLIKVIYWHLRNQHSKAVQFLDRSVLEERIQFSITKARRYGLGTVSDLAGFAALMFELAPNFDDHPSFRTVLADANLPAEAKLRRLSQVIGDKEWQEAAQLYDRSHWLRLRKARRG